MTKRFRRIWDANALWDASEKAENAEARRLKVRRILTAPELMALGDLADRWAALPREEFEMRHLMGWLYFGHTPPLVWIERQLYATPFPGAFGLAGYVVSVEGTPPKGILVVRIERPRTAGEAIADHLMLVTYSDSPAPRAFGFHGRHGLTPREREDMDVRDVVAAYLTERIRQHPEDLALFAAAAGAEVAR